jgi:hypothetical protein
LKPILHVFAAVQDKWVAGPAILKLLLQRSFTLLGELRNLKFASRRTEGSSGMSFLILIGGAASSMRRCWQESLRLCRLKAVQFTPSGALSVGAAKTSILVA